MIGQSDRLNDRLRSQVFRKHHEQTADAVCSIIEERRQTARRPVLLRAIDALRGSFIDEGMVAARTIIEQCFHK